MAFTIKLKKILDDGTYAAEREFVIGTTKNAPQYLYDFSYAWSNESEQNYDVSNATDLRTLEAVGGDKWQAFDVNDEKLGFILMYRGLGRYNRVYRKMWMLYNEEIGCYANFITDAQDGDSPIYMFFNGQYEGNTVNDIFYYMATIWESGGYLWSEGMDNTKNAPFQIGWEAGNHLYTSPYSGKEKLAFGKMRYLSSWYKLWTGKFYKESDMKYTTLLNGDTFYFGNLRKGIIKSPYYNPDNYTLEEDSDPSYIFTDIIYGTDPFKYIKEYNQDLIFESGMTISLGNYFYVDGQYGSRYNAYITVSKNIADEGEESKIAKITQVMSNMDSFYWEDSDYQGHRETSALNVMLNANKWDNNIIVPYGDEYGKNTSYGVGLFISPYYSEVSISEFNQFLRDQDFSKLQWKQLEGRVITFVQTGIANFVSEDREGYLNPFKNVTPFDNFHTYAFSGWTNLADGNIYNKFCSTYYFDAVAGTEDTTVGVVNLESAEDWIKFLDFRKKIVTPSGGGTGGNWGGTGGGSGVGDDSGDNNENRILEGLNAKGIEMLVIAGNNPSQEYTNIGALTQWIERNNPIEIFGESVSTKQQTVCSLKRFAAPSLPNISEMKNWAGIDGKLATAGAKINTQFQEIELGNFNIQRYFDNFLDFTETKIQIYLPFSGIYELNPSDVIDNRCVLSVVIDWLTGMLEYHIKVNNGLVNSILYSFSGNCAIDIPITSTDYSSKISSNINMILGVGTSVAGAVTGNAPIFAGGIGMILKSTLGKQKNYTNVQGSISTTSGFLSPKTPYIFITRPKMQLPKDFGKMYGWKSSLSGKLGNFSGATTILDVHLEGLGEATSTELAEIESILKSGVIL